MIEGSSVKQDKKSKICQEAKKKQQQTSRNSSLQSHTGTKDKKM